MNVPNPLGVRNVTIERAAVVRALSGLGDMLCVVPAFRALRAALPDCHVTLVGLPSAATFATRYPRYIDAFLEFPGFPGIPERPEPIEPLSDFAGRARKLGFDVALQMQGDGTVINDFMPLLGADVIAGYAAPGASRPPNAILLGQPTGSEVHRWLAVVAELGAASRDDTLEFPVLPNKRAAWTARAASLNLTARRYACLHPGASLPERQWPPMAFAAVADDLAGQGLTVVLTGTASERELARAVAARMTGPCLDLCGLTTLDEAASLIEDAAVLVTNDTGMSHLAAAMRTPSVVIFLAAEPDRWAPLDCRRHRAILGASLASRALNDMTVSRADLPTVEEVRGLVSELLAAGPGAGAPDGRAPSAPASSEAARC